MPFAYVIYSPKLDRFYVGATDNNIAQRLQKHNSRHYGAKAVTAGATDWTIFLSFEVSDYEHALRIEKLIKAMKASKYIKNIKKYPELEAKILQQTSKL